MEHPITGCPQRMDLITLSAWRDRELPAPQAGQIEAHVRGCQACQAVLTDLDQVGRAIRRFDPPHMSDVVWGDVRANIRERQGKPMENNRQKATILGSLTAVAVISVLTAVIFVFTSAKPGANSTITTVPPGTATLLPNPTATPPKTGLTVAPGQDWTATKGVPNGLQVAFAAGSPLQGYACGLSTNQQGNNGSPLHIYITQDGGGTWQSSQTTTIAGVDCRITINPTQPQDVVLLASNCLVGCEGNTFLHAWRTLDGGLHWNPLDLPAGAQLGYQYVWNPVYVGATLYVSVTFAGKLGGKGQRPDSQHSIAISRNQQPLAWLDLAVAHANIGAGDYAFAVGNRYLVEENDFTTVPNAFVTTTDDGQTWQRWVPQGLPGGALGSFPLLVSADQSSVYLSFQSTIYQSTDGTQTWHSLEPIPQSAGQLFSQSPDGTFYTLDTQGNAWRHGPQDAAWKVAAPGANHESIIALSWDANGHPVALWGNHLTFTGTHVSESLDYHAP